MATGDVERVRIVEHGGVAIGAADERDDELAGLQSGSGQPGGRHGDAGGALHGRVVTQHFLHRVGPQCRFCLEPRQLFGVFDELHGAVADEVHGRLESGAEQQHRRRRELVLRQLLALVLYRHELAEQILTGALAQRREVVEHPGAHGFQVVLGTAKLAVADPDVERDGCTVAPGEELVAHVQRHAQDLGDDRDGKLRRIARHEFHRLACSGGAGGQDVEQFGRDHFDPGSQRLHGASREDLADQPAVARVHGRVDGEHGRRIDRCGHGAPRPQPQHLRRRERHRLRPQAHPERVAAQHVGAHAMARADIAERPLADQPPLADGVVHRERIGPQLQVGHEPGVEAPPPGVAAQQRPGQTVTGDPADPRLRAHAFSLPRELSVWAGSTFPCHDVHRNVPRHADRRLHEPDR